MNEQRIPFSKEDEECLASTGLWGMIAALAAIIGSFFSVILAMINLGVKGFFSEIVGLLLSIIMGIFLIQASQAFLKVANTDEADEYFLLLGFGKLKSYFKMIGLLIIIPVILLVSFMFFGLALGILWKF